MKERVAFCLVPNKSKVTILFFNKKGSERTMKRQKREDSGITLVALVISIIVMLILVGVSLNAMVGENGIVTQAQLSTVESRFAGYKEELEMNIVADIATKKIENSSEVTLLRENVKKYISSIEEQDADKFAILEGELYYIGNEEIQMKAAVLQDIKVLEEGTELDEFVNQLESLAIEAVLKRMTGDSFVCTDEEGNSSEVGVKLYDKNQSNGNIWKIIIEVNNDENVATYGTGWTYVEAGKTIDGLGMLKQSYIINYNTRKAVRFDATKHTMLAHGANLAVDDGTLVLNIDPINMSNENDWGDNIILYGVNSGDDFFTSTALKFDGEDDYLEINMDSIDITKGITVEFYGKFLGTGTDTPFLCKTIRYNDGYAGRFRSSIWNGNMFRCCMGSGSCGSAWTTGGDRDHWIQKVFVDSDGFKNGGYITFVADVINDKLSLYYNGTEVGTTSCNHSWLVGGGLTNSSIPFTVGLICQGRSYTEDFANMELYSCRLYANVLDYSDIKANYTATVGYHNILVGGGNAETGGNTGGVDIEDVEIDD